MASRKIVVTGGAGFIGSHLVDELVCLGHEVLVVDNLSSGFRQHVNTGARWIELDILDPRLNDAFARFHPEIVFHFAAQVSVSASVQQPVDDAKRNILGTLSVLEACKAADVRKLIYASSAAVYGAPEQIPIPEAHRINPISFYGISKHVPERYINTYSQLFGLDYTVLRYANVYGNRQDMQGEGGVVSIFASMLREGKRPVIFGSGEQTRDFIYVKDIISANVAAFDHGGSKVMNISSNRSVSINELLREMCALCGKSFDPVYLDWRPGDIKDSRLDNRLAMEQLGWAPRYALQDGIKEMLALGMT
jgi:UDP-glucose 4-epimerase